MSRPAILTVDDDPAVSRAVARDLRRRYGQDYQVVRASSGTEGLDALREIKAHIQEVNDFLSTLPTSEVPEGKITRELSRKYPQLRVWVLVMEEFQNYFETDTGQRRYVSDFRIADLIVRLRFPIARRRLRARGASARRRRPGGQSAGADGARGPRRPRGGRGLLRGPRTRGPAGRAMIPAARSRAGRAGRRRTAERGLPRRRGRRPGRGGAPKPA